MLPMLPATVRPSIAKTSNDKFSNLMNTYSIGIDIGGTNTDIGIVRDDGTIVRRDSLPTDHYDTATSYMAAIADQIQRMLDAARLTTVQGIGIGAPNGNHQTVRIEADTANLRIKTPIPLGDFLTKQFGVPVRLDNDANAAAVGEMVYGGARGMRHFIMLTLGTGVGSGIVVDGRLLHGSHGMAGELGHVIVSPNGRACSCGRNGCLEMYASARGICQNYREALRKVQPTANEPEGLTCRFVGESALRGDPVAMEAYDTTARWLGLALANAVAFSEPEAVFLMGGPTRAGDALMQPLRHHFEKNLLFLYKDKVQILLSQLPKNDAAILGAAALGTAWQ